MQRYTRHIDGPRQTTQGSPIAKRRSRMTKTSDGAYAFKLDDWGRLDRFLILGADSGSYYASQRKLVRQNAAVLEKCLRADGPRTVRQIATLSSSGRAVNNDTCLFGLAMAFAHGDVETRRLAAIEASSVIRTGTHLFHFTAFVKDLGKGLGRTVRRAIANWYNDRPVENLAYQLLKYRQRDGWSHADVLRWAHVRPDSTERQQMLQWVWNGRVKPKVAGDLNDNLPAQVYAASDIHTLDVTKKRERNRAIKLIVDHRLPHECIPNDLKVYRETWEALLPDMPIFAMIRNLNKMTQVGLLHPGEEALTTVMARLTDQKLLQKARVHPMAILKAFMTYQSGRGGNFGGKQASCWQPVQQVVDALDQAFYLAFKSVEPTNKRRLLAIDVSGSMQWPGSMVRSMANLTSHQLAGAMAMTVVRTEPNYRVTAFSHKPVQVKIGARMRLESVLQHLNQVRAGYTNCAAPMLEALENGWKVDTFEILTDNETNAYNSMHPALALQRYRDKTGIPAKLVVYGMVANNISIADPEDGGMLDVVGFDTDTPVIVNDFIRGGFGSKD